MNWKDGYMEVCRPDSVSTYPILAVRSLAHILRDYLQLPQSKPYTMFLLLDD